MSKHEPTFDLEEADLALDLALEEARIKKIESKIKIPKDGVDGINGLDGKDGADGKKGVDGKDGQKGDKGEQGVKGEPGKNGKDGKGLKGDNGKDGKDGTNGKDGKTGKAGKNGLDGSPDTGKEIVLKINELPLEKELQIDASHIKNLPKSKLVSTGGSPRVTVAVAGQSPLLGDITLQAGAGITLSQSANNITVNSTGATAIGDIVTGGTKGSVLFINPNGILAQDNANLFWDTTNARLGIGNSSPSVKLQVSAGSSGLSGTAGTNVIFESNSTNFLTFLNPSAVPAAIIFGNASSNTDNYILVQNGAGFNFATGGVAGRFTIGPTGNIGINSPASRPLTITGTVVDAADEPVMLVSGTLYSTAHSQYAARFVPVITPTSPSTQIYGGLDLIAAPSDSSVTNYLSGATVFGFRGGVFGLGNGLLGTSIGLELVTDQTAGGSITTGYGLLVDNPSFLGGGSGTGTFYGINVSPMTGFVNNVGALIGEATGTKNTNLLIGTGTQPAGSWSIYNASTKANYFGGLITTYNNITTVSNGIPSELAKVDTTGLTANVGATTLYAVPSTGAGMYRVNSLVVETTAGSLSSTLPNVQIVYTDNETGGVVTIDATPILGIAGIGQTGALTANTISTTSTGVIVVNAKASTNIQYQTVNYASNLAGMAYALHLKLESL